MKRSRLRSMTKSDRARGRTGRIARCSGWPRTATAADRLLPEDKAYECFCTPEELAADRAAQEAASSRRTTSVGART